MRRSGVFIGVTALGIVATTPLLLNDNFIYHLGILVGIQAILALSLHLMLRIRQLSLAQAGFMGIGAYTSALLSRAFAVDACISGAGTPIAVVDFVAR